MGWDDAWGGLWSGSWGGGASSDAAPAPTPTFRTAPTGNPLEVIRAQLGAGLRSIAVAATLTKRTPTTRASGAQAAGTRPTATALPCYGFRKEKAEAGQRTITARLLGATIPGRVVPEPGDLVTIGGDTFEIAGEVKHDAAAATYVCVGTLPGPGRR